MLLSEEEVKIKTRLWFAENGDFLKERECKLKFPSPHPTYISHSQHTVKREKLAQEKAEREKLKKV